MYLQVAIPVPLPRLFDYLPAADSGDDLPAPGSRVIVPFGRRQLVGIVTAHKGETDVPAAQLRSILLAPDSRPALPEDTLALCRWAAAYYHHPLGECLHLALPPRMRDPKPLPASDRYLQVSEPQAIDRISPRAWRQRALFEHLLFNGPLRRGALNADGFDNPLIGKLLVAGLVREMPDDFTVAEPTANPSPITLNAEQQLAVDSVVQGFGEFQTSLLEGVTGSGKTEVYLRCIDACIKRGQQALVLIPEIGLTPQTLARFENRFPDQVVALHSGLSDGERLRNWRRCRNGGATILLGTRSAVFTPIPDLGLIIIDEEHDLSFKAQDGCRYSARDVAVKRASLRNCPVLLGSATPSLETLKNASDQRYQWLHLRHRAGDAKPPQLSLIDIRDARLEAGIGGELRNAIRQCIERGEQALIFLNRRGFAPALQCNSCGWLADCDHCDARMTVHWRFRRLHCHHCDARSALPNACPDCGNPNMMFRGPGTERLEMTLREWFPGSDVIRIDRDTTANKSAMADSVATIREGRPAILVGTQMLAKGHHFPAVTLVGVIDLDGALFSADLRAAERCGQLLVQVAGRAGRGDRPGRVLIQSRNPEHPALETLVTRGYPEFARQLLAERRAMHLPPYGYLTVLRADADSLEQAEKFLTELRAVMPAHRELNVVGPLPAPMTRKAGRYRAVLLLTATARGPLHTALNTMVARAHNARGYRGLNWQVDVDPAELF